MKIAVNVADVGGCKCHQGSRILSGVVVVVRPVAVCIFHRLNFHQSYKEFCLIQISCIFAVVYFTLTQNYMSEYSTELAPLLDQSGLEVEKRNEIGETLGRFFAKASEWSEKINTIVVTDPTDTITMNMAREGRLGLRAMRLEAEKLVKEKRASVQQAMSAYTLEDKLWLKSGQMMELTFKHLEGQLENQEKFAERFEADRRAKLKADRLAILAPLGYFDGNGLDFMTDVAFDALIGGLKAKIQADKEEAERIEAERIAKENAEREERARIAAENARLKAEAEAKEKELAIERARVEAERQRAEKERREAEEKANRERLEAEAKAKAERDAIEAQAAKERAEAAAKLKAEQDRIAELERAAKAKEAAELAEKARIEAQRLADEKAAKAAADKAAKAPKKEKLTTWIDGLALTAPAEFADDLIVGGILQKFDALKVWAKSQIDAL